MAKWFMKRRIYFVVLVFAVLFIVFAGKFIKAGGNPPTPLEVANAIKTKWESRQFSELESYIIDLYSSYSDYIPALLAACFHNIVYEGKLSDAKDKTDMIQQWVDGNPGEYETSFENKLSVLQWLIQVERDVYQRKGVSESELQPDPATVRDAWGESFVPIDILFYAPERYITGS